MKAIILARVSTEEQNENSPGTGFLVYFGDNAF